MKIGWYSQQNCTGGLAAFITSQQPIPTGLTRVGMPGFDTGMSAKDPTISEFSIALGYAAGQLAKTIWTTKLNFRLLLKV